MPRVRLNKEPRCSTPMTGRQGLVFGAIFTAVSIPIVLIAWGVIPARVHRGVPMWVVQSIAGCFMAIGLGSLLYGVHRSLRQRRRLAHLAQRPGETWYADHDWDPERVRDDNPRRLWKHVVVSVYMAVFLLPFNWWAFLSDQGPIFVQIIVGFFDLIMVFSVGYLGYRAVQLLKFGRSYVRFGAFPLHLGDTVRLTFGMRSDLRMFDRLRFVLRFVEEVFETRDSGKDRTTTVVAYELWSHEQDVDATHIGLGGCEAEIAFELPTEGGSGEPEYLTNLTDRPPRYWELEVRGDAPGVDYLARFPLPVYLPASTDRPGSVSSELISASER